MIHPKFSIRALLNIISTLDYQMSTFGQPVEAAITSKLQSSLAPSYLKIINESYMHNVSKGAETHFKVIVVTEKFNNLSLIKAAVPQNHRWSPVAIKQISNICDSH
ncbi:hypothetical protein HUJ05_007699 [Dendroctonus ponderosae]|nr:hypothetical protein HUJ05_007699 [Dendroctonus ponderosae]